MTARSKRARSAPRSALAALAAIGTTLAALAACAGPPPTALVPGAPTDLTATPAHQSVTIHFTPGDDHGHPIVNHRSSLDGGVTWTPFDPPATTSPVTVTGLTNGDTHALRLRAVNDQGVSPPSEAISVTGVAHSYALRFGGDATSSGGSSLGDSGYGIAAFPDGGVIAVGMYHTPAMLGPDVALPGAPDRSHGLVVRLDAGGRVVWHASLLGGASGDVHVYDVAVLPDGSAAVTGAFWGSMEAPGATTVTTVGTAPFIATIGPDGAWRRVIQAASGTTAPRAFAYSIAERHDGGVVITGEFRGDLTFGDVSIVSPGSTSMFAAATDADGTWAWALAAGSSGSDFPWVVAAGDDGSTYVAGYVAGDAAFGSDVALTALSPQTGFVARITPEGTWDWATHASGSTSGFALALLAMDGGGALVGGGFTGQAWFGGPTSVTSGGSGDDAFVGMVESDGTWAWHMIVESEGRAEVTGLDRLHTGRVVAVGMFTEVASFDGASDVVSAGGTDVLVAAFDDVGSWAWAAGVGNTGLVSSYGIAALADGGASIAGTFSSTLWLPVADLVSAGGRDGFVVKIGPDGTW